MLNKHSQMLLSNKRKYHFHTSQTKADSYATQQEFDIVTRECINEIYIVILVDCICMHALQLWSVHHIIIACIRISIQYYYFHGNQLES